MVEVTGADLRRHGPDGEKCHAHVDMIGAGGGTCPVRGKMVDAGERGMSSDLEGDRANPEVVPAESL